MKRVLLFVIYLSMFGCSSPNKISEKEALCQEKPTRSLENRNVQTISLSEQATKVEGAVTQDKQLGYTFEGRAGQTVKYQTDDEVCTWIFSPDNELLSTRQLPHDGKYILQVSTPKGSRTFSLNVSLTTNQSQAQKSDSTPPQSTASNTNLAAIEKRPEQEDPEKFIQEHYFALNQRNYRFTWTDLAPEFKQKVGGFSSYTEWWDTVEEVQLSSTRLVSRNGDRAIVDANLQYKMKDGNTVRDDRGRIYLQWNAEEKHWDITGKAAS